MILQGRAVGGGVYTTFADTRTRRGGRFRVTYRFRDPGSRGQTFRFRAKLRGDKDYPFATGYSPASPCASAEAAPVGSRAGDERGEESRGDLLRDGGDRLHRAPPGRAAARARGSEIHVLVRPGSEDKLTALVERYDGAGRVHAVAGDLSESKLGVDQATRDALRGRVDHFFHLAAIYDMTADDTQNALLNVGGTQHAIDLANDLQAGCFHHASSIAVAGSYEGHFTEDMFDEGQRLPSPTTRRSSSPRSSCARAWPARGACTGRRSSSATRAPARWTRSTGPTTSSR